MFHEYYIHAETKSIYSTGELWVHTKLHTSTLILHGKALPDRDGQTDTHTKTLTSTLRIVALYCLFHLCCDIWLSLLFLLWDCYISRVFYLWYGCLCSFCYETVTFHVHFLCLSATESLSENLTSQTVVNCQKMHSSSSCVQADRQTDRQTDMHHWPFLSECWITHTHTHTHV